MCAIAYVNEVPCSSQNELRHALGLKKLPMAGSLPMMHDCCLCPVDVRKAARQAKFKYEYDGNMAHYLTKAKKEK